jgi:hypothetical protein
LPRGAGDQKFLKAAEKLAAAVLLLLCVVARAQDLEPRSFSPAPVGTNFAVVSYGRTSGDVILDPTLPVTDASASFNTATLGYSHSFGLLGRQTSVAVGMPYVLGSGQALLNGVPAHLYRSGLGDLRVRLSYLFVGSPAVNLQEFKKQKARTVVGVAMTIAVPLGQYDPDLLVNIGANRWAFRPEIGVSRSVRSWLLEMDVSSWFFLQNSNFFHGQVREQAPIGSVQAHVSYTFRPGLWLALDGTYYTGGRTHVNGIRGNDLQQNARLGTTLALPITRSQSVKVSYSKGAVTRVGGNFTSFAVAYQLRWFTRK